MWARADYCNSHHQRPRRHKTIRSHLKTFNLNDCTLGFYLQTLNLFLQYMKWGLILEAKIETMVAVERNGSILVDHSCFFYKSDKMHLAILEGKKTLNSKDWTENKDSEKVALIDGIAYRAHRTTNRWWHAVDAECVFIIYALNFVSFVTQFSKFRYKNKVLTFLFKTRFLSYKDWSKNLLPKIRWLHGVFGVKVQSGSSQNWVPDWTNFCHSYSHRGHHLAVTCFPGKILGKYFL